MVSFLFSASLWWDTESLSYKNEPEPPEELTQALRCQSARCNHNMFPSPQTAVFDLMVLGHICPSERKRALGARSS